MLAAATSFVLYTANDSLMLITQQVVDGLYWIESAQRNLYKDGVPIAHRTIPQTRQLQCLHALGICNGFQALIKLGLVPYGEIRPQTDDSPTLTMNSIGRHQSKMVYTKVVTNKSPWLKKAELGGVYTIPISHGEGRFVASKEWCEKLFANGQVATQYVDMNGNPTMDEDFNPNASYAAIEGITSPDGRVLGKMGHSERIGQAVAVNVYGDQNQKIFESGVEYFK